jgi:hypothetical protein
MLYTVAFVLGVLWLLGLVTGYTAGYFIHILLVIAVAMVVINLIQGRRSVKCSCT